jgi:hypothetical protein
MTDTTTTEAPAAETNKTELVMSRDGLIATPASSVQVQARTLMIPRPAVFYLEPARQLRQADAGNSHDQISKGVHQVDPSRTVGMSPLMPGPVQGDRQPVPEAPRRHRQDVAQVRRLRRLPERDLLGAQAPEGAR